MPDMPRISNHLFFHFCSRLLARLDKDDERLKNANTTYLAANTTYSCEYDVFPRIQLIRVDYLLDLLIKDLWTCLDLHLFVL